MELMLEEVQEAPAQQRRAVEAAQRALNQIDVEKYWNIVMNSVAPKAEANERIRARSLAKASHHVLR